MAIRADLLSRIFLPGGRRVPALSRDRSALRAWNGPGSAAHHCAQERSVLRCARDTGHSASTIALTWRP
jgi:hypothetical protein